MYTGIANVTLTLTLASLHSLPVRVHNSPPLREVDLDDEDDNPKPSSSSTRGPLGSALNHPTPEGSIDLEGGGASAQGASEGSKVGVSEGALPTNMGTNQPIRDPTQAPPTNMGTNQPIRDPTQAPPTNMGESQPIRDNATLAPPTNMGSLTPIRAN